MKHLYSFAFALLLLVSSVATAAPLNDFAVLEPTTLTGTDGAYVASHPDRRLGESIDVGQKVLLEKISGDGEARLFISNSSQQLQIQGNVTTSADSPEDFYDSNGDGQMSPVDALVIINHLQREDSYNEEYDHSDDGIISALDVLLVINALQRQSDNDSPSTQAQNVGQPISNLPGVDIPNVRLIPDADVVSVGTVIMDFDIQRDLTRINFEGIGIDLTNRDGEAFVMNALYNAPGGAEGQIHIDVYSDETHHSRCVVALSDDTTGLDVESTQAIVGVRFDDCTTRGIDGGVNFSNVGAIVLSLNATRVAGAQFLVSKFRTDAATLCNVEDCGLVSSDPSIPPSSQPPSPSSSPSASASSDASPSASASSSPAASASSSPAASASSSPAASASSSSSASPSPSASQTDICEGKFGVNLDHIPVNGYSPKNFNEIRNLPNSPEATCLNQRLDEIIAECIAGGVPTTSTLGYDLDACVVNGFQVLAGDQKGDALQDLGENILNTYNGIPTLPSCTRILTHSGLGNTPVPQDGTDTAKIARRDAMKDALINLVNQALAQDNARGDHICRGPVTVPASLAAAHAEFGLRAGAIAGYVVPNAARNTPEWDAFLAAEVVIFKPGGADWPSLPGLGSRYVVYFDENCQIATAPTADDESCIEATLEGFISPISLVWDGNEPSEYSVARFPLDPSCHDCLYEWKGSSSTPLLVYDPEHLGKITNATQLFGSWTFGGKRAASTHSNFINSSWKHGYEALSQLDIDGDGVVAGSELEDLGLWFDNNRNGVSESGEVKTLSELGILTIEYQEPHKDEVTGDYRLALGYTRKVGDKVVSGGSLDWFAKPRARGMSGLSSSTNLNKLLLQHKDKTASDFSRELPGDESGPNMAGVWKWRSGVTDLSGKEKSFDGVLLIGKDSKGFHGGTITDLNYVDRRNAKQKTMLRFEGFRMSEVGENSNEYTFTQRTSTGKVMSKLSYNSGKVEITGKSVVTDNDGRTIHYNWVAVPY